MRLSCLHYIQNALARAVVAAFWSSNPDRILKLLHWLKVQECIEYKVIFTPYKLLQSSSPCYLHDLITVQPCWSTRSSALVTLRQPSVDCSLKITKHSPISMLLLTCRTIFLLLFVFLISSILHHHPALLHSHALILDCWLAFLVAFSTLILKLSFSQSLSLHSQLSLPQADLLESWPLVVWKSLVAVVLVSVAG